MTRCLRSLVLGMVVAAAVPASPSEAHAREPAAEKAPKRKAKARKPKAPSAGERLDHASVIVVPKGCAGSVVHSRFHVLTAAHCIPEGMTELTVRLRDGREIESQLEYLDESRDLALLHLAAEAAVEPLALANTPPAVGQKLLARQRFDRGGRVQHARVRRIGRCPSLPDVNDAVFTTINAKPGDSGAPIVDERLRVVAVIHGGAACHIAAPVYPLALALLVDDDGELDPAATVPPPVTATPVVAEKYRFGPFIFQRSVEGFRFDFAWRSRRPPAGTR